MTDEETIERLGMLNIELSIALRSSETALIEAANLIRMTLPRVAQLFDAAALVAREALDKADDDEGA